MRWKDRVRTETTSPRRRITWLQNGWEPRQREGERAAWSIHAALQAFRHWFGCKISTSSASKNRRMGWTSLSWNIHPPGGLPFRWPIFFVLRAPGPSNINPSKPIVAPFISSGMEFHIRLIWNFLSSGSCFATQMRFRRTLLDLAHRMLWPVDVPGMKSIHGEIPETGVQDQ